MDGPHAMGATDSDPKGSDVARARRAFRGMFFACHLPYDKATWLAGKGDSGTPGLDLYRRDNALPVETKSTRPFRTVSSFFISSRFLAWTRSKRAGGETWRLGRRNLRAASNRDAGI